jgi:hypothetical protein
MIEAWNAEYDPVTEGASRERCFGPEVHRSQFHPLRLFEQIEEEN